VRTCLLGFTFVNVSSGLELAVTLPERPRFFVASFYKDSRVRLVFVEGGRRPVYARVRFGDGLNEVFQSDFAMKGAQAGPPRTLQSA